MPAAALEGLDAVIHLAGANVAERWTADQRRRILESRRKGTRLVAETLARLHRRPATLISASAIGYYGVEANSPVDESGAAGDDFLANVVKEWEASAAPARTAGIRVVHPRIGVVLASNGGAMSRLLPFFRTGVGGPIGDGRQWMSWISMRDLVRAFQHLLENSSIQGAVNLVAPTAVQNAEFTKALGHVLNRPAVVPVPAFALKLAYGAMAEGTILASQRVVPKVLLESGFMFEHPTIVPALRHELA